MTFAPPTQSAVPSPFLQHCEASFPRPLPPPFEQRVDLPVCEDDRSIRETIYRGQRNRWRTARQIRRQIRAIVRAYALDELRQIAA